MDCSPPGSSLFCIIFDNFFLLSLSLTLELTFVILDLRTDALSVYQNASLFIFYFS